jgi:hypothetical protein
MPKKLKKWSYVTFLAKLPPWAEGTVELYVKTAIGATGKKA